MNWKRELEQKGNLEPENLEMSAWCSSAFRLGCNHNSMEIRWNWSQLQTCIFCDAKGCSRGVL